MDKQSLDRLRRSLREQRDALHLRLVVAKRQHRKVGLWMSEIKDEGDRAAASVTNEMTAVQQTQAENLLKAVHAALDRIDNGSFGECLNCGQEISVKRLAAIPWTRYCIVCQELIDGR